MNSSKKAKDRIMSEKSYTHKVNEWLVSNARCSVIDCCIKFGYYPIAVKIMGMDDNNKGQIQKTLKSDKSIKELYLRYSNDKDANMRKGKNRNWTTFFQDMITGWVLEDLVIEMFRRQGVDIGHNGKDFQRVIDIGKDVSQESDCVVKVGEITRKVELSNEFNTILDDYGYIEKRSPAIYNLWRNKAIWLYRELKSGKYVLIDFATEPVKTHIRYHQVWDKDVHRYVLEENGKKVRDDRLLAPELISVAGCGIDGKDQPELTEIIDSDSPPRVWGLGGKKNDGNKNDIVKEEENRPTVVINTDVKESNRSEDEKRKRKKELHETKKETEPENTPKHHEDSEPQDVQVDIMDNSDDGETDWNAVAVSQVMDIDF